MQTDILNQLIASLQTVIILLTTQLAALPSNTLQQETQPLPAITALSTIPTDPTSFTAINNLYKGAVVNILCKGSGKFKGATATGVVISSTGLMLTNAHIAQYMLLEQASNAPISCTIRTGSPARVAYTAEVIYIPPTWVNTHAHQIISNVQRSTGEDDYALLQITKHPERVLPKEFTFIEPDPSLLSVLDDQPVLIRAYPAEFLSSRITVSSLHPVATVTSVTKVATFTKEDSGQNPTIDLISLGGTIVAQGGSSGGAVINSGANLVGLIVTSTRKKETKDRNLKAITLSHINSSLKASTGKSLDELLAMPVTELTEEFHEELIESAQFFADEYNK